MKVKKSPVKARKNRGSRSGRYSVKEVYQGRTPQTSDLPRSGHKPPLRLLPRLERDRSGMAADYSCRLEPGKIARVKLEQCSPRLAWIDWVFIPKQYRGSGLGRQMLERVLKDADRLGIELGLEARACAGLDQRALVSFYRSLGFVLSGKRGTFGPEMRRAAQTKSIRLAA